MRMLCRSQSGAADVYTPCVWGRGDMTRTAFRSRLQMALLRRVGSVVGSCLRRREVWSLPPNGGLLSLSRLSFGLYPSKRSTHVVLYDGSMVERCMPRASSGTRGTRIRYSSCPRPGASQLRLSVRGDDVSA